MSVPAVNLTIDKGTTFSTSIKVKRDGAALNLTGYTLSAQMRKHYNASSYYTFTTTSPSPTQGIVNVGMASSITSTIPVGRYVYDLLIAYAGTTIKVVEGTIIVKGTASQ
jgi:hypothetical protein